MSNQLHEIIKDLKDQYEDAYSREPNFVQMDVVRYLELIAHFHIIDGLYSRKICNHTEYKIYNLDIDVVTESDSITVGRRNKT